MKVIRIEDCRGCPWYHMFTRPLCVRENESKEVRDAWRENLRESYLAMTSCGIPDWCPLEDER